MAITTPLAGLMGTVQIDVATALNAIAAIDLSQTWQGNAAAQAERSRLVLHEKCRIAEDKAHTTTYYVQQAEVAVLREIAKQAAMVK